MATLAYHVCTNSDVFLRSPKPILPPSSEDLKAGTGLLPRLGGGLSWNAGDSIASDDDIIRGLEGISFNVLRPGDGGGPPERRGLGDRGAMMPSERLRSRLGLSRGMLSIGSVSTSFLKREARGWLNVSFEGVEGVPCIPERSSREGQIRNNPSQNTYQKMLAMYYRQRSNSRTGRAVQAIRKPRIMWLYPQIQELLGVDTSDLSHSSPRS